MSRWFAWKSGNTSYFGKNDESVEKFQKPWNFDMGLELVETSYFGFCVPEANIACDIYHWFHPKLGVASGGISMFKGKKINPILAEYMDWRNYQPMPDDLTDCTYATGVRIDMIDQSKEWRISFEDQNEGVAFEFTSRAIMPPAFRPNGGHLCQALKNNGTLLHEGKEYRIDSYYTMDRSWGPPRSERRNDIPPPGWSVGVFDDHFAFHAFAYDSPSQNADQAQRYPDITEGSHAMWGYIWDGERLRGMKDCHKLTTREPDGIFPQSLQLRIIDEINCVHDFTGTIIGRNPIFPWPNMGGTMCFVRWSTGSRTRYGCFQEALYSRWARDHWRA